MCSEKKNKLLGAIYNITIFYYILIGVWVLIVAFQNYYDSKILLSVLIMLGSIPHLLIYFVNKTKTSYLVIGLVGIAFSILFLSSDIFDTAEICMIWGCIDICRGTTEIIDVSPNVRKHKIEWVEIAISTGDIIIGVLLCIHLLGGIKLHLIYFGLAFLISAAKGLSELIISRKQNEKSSNNN